MKSRLFTIVLACLLTILGAHSTQAQCSLTGVPTSFSWPPPPADGLYCPAGDGTPSVQAWVNSPPHIVPEVTAILLDSNSVPIANYPREDMWLEFEGSCSCICLRNPIIADSNTDANGETDFINVHFYPPSSCWAAQQINLEVNGIACASVPYLTPVITFKNLDLNCDGVIDVNDEPLFTQLWNDTSVDRACLDFNLNGNPQVNDVTVMAMHRWSTSPSHECPPK